MDDLDRHLSGKPGGKVGAVSCEDKNLQIAVRRHCEEVATAEFHSALSFLED